MSSKSGVPRPIKKTEFQILFASSSAEKGWRDLRAVRLNELADAWDTLTRNPEVDTVLCSSMRGALAVVTYQGKNFQRRQLKLSLTYGARIWYFIDEKLVLIERVFTNHPNQTK